MTTKAPSSPGRCERCDAPLPAGKDSGHCPRCLLQFAMEGGPATTAGPAGSPGATGAEPPSIADLQPLFPAYELQSLLGRGGMGAVYRARHTKLHRNVAIKVLLPDLVSDPAFAERFEREARALASLSHSGIVGVHDFGHAGGFFYLVMQYVEGASLRDLLAQGKLTTRDVLAFVPQLCDALQYAHDHGIVHRDIKPENILVDLDGKVHVADFGLAKMTGNERPDIGLTRTQQVLGTPLYMAPEQIGAAGSVDHRADLYSLGVVLYEMLTGNLPIGRFEPPSTKSRDARPFDRVVMRSLENDPGQRYQQAREVKQDVQAAGDGGPVAAAGPRSMPPWFAHVAPWTGFAVMLAVSFAAWFGGTQGYVSRVVRLEFVMGNDRADAWHSWILQLPSWFVVPLAASISTMVTMRRLGYRIPRWMPAGLAMAGVVFCSVPVVECVFWGSIMAYTGPVVGAGVFTWWAVAEVANALRSGRAR